VRPILSGGQGAGRLRPQCTKEAGAGVRRALKSFATAHGRGFKERRFRWCPTLPSKLAFQPALSDLGFLLS